MLRVDEMGVSCLFFDCSCPRGKMPSKYWLYLVLSIVVVFKGWREKYISRVGTEVRFSSPHLHRSSCASLPLGAGQFSLEG